MNCQHFVFAGGAVVEGELGAGGVADGAGAGDVRKLALDVRGRMPADRPGVVAVFDHVRDALTLCAAAWPEDGADPRAAWDAAQARLDEAEAALRVQSATRVYLGARSGWKSGRASAREAQPEVESPMMPIPRGRALSVVGAGGGMVLALGVLVFFVARKRYVVVCDDDDVVPESRGYLFS